MGLVPVKVADPLEPRGETVVVLGSHKSDEDCLAVRPSSGAKITCEAHARKDKHDLYEVKTSSDLFASVRSRAKMRGKPPRLSFKLEK